MRRVGWMLAALCVVVLGGCNAQLRGSERDGEIKSVFDQLRHHQDTALKARMAPDLLPKVDPATLAKIESYIPSEEPVARKLIATTVFKTTSGSSSVTASDEYRFSKGLVLFDTVLVRASDTAPWRLEGFNVRYATFEQLKAANFTLIGKAPVQYLFLLWVFASPALMIAALVKVIKTPGLRRKWLWGILAFFGVFVAHMNWMNGETSFLWVTLQLVGFGIVKGASSFSPWILTATVPVGAVLILTGLWANPARAKRKPDLPPAAPTPSET